MREAGEQRLEGDAGLAPEATAHMRYDDPHLVVRELEGVAEQVSDCEGRLGARPDRDLVARLPLDDGDVGLKRDVLDGGVRVLALDYPGRLGEARFDVALADPREIGDVGPRLRAERGFDVLVAAELWVDTRSAVLESFHLAQHRRENLILEFDQLDRPAGYVQALGCYGGDGLAEVADDFFCKYGLVDDVKPDAVVELLAGEHGMHSWEALGLGGVDREDLRPGVGALFHLGVQHARQHHVARVHGPAGELHGVIGPLNVLADVGRGRGDGGFRHISVPPCSRRSAGPIRRARLR